MRLREVYVIMVVVVCLILSALCAGCQPVTAEYEGRQRTATQIEAEVAAKVKAAAAAEALETAKAKLDAERLQRAAEAEARAAEDQAKREQQQAARIYASNLRKVAMQSENARAELEERLAEMTEHISGTLATRHDAATVGLADGLANIATALDASRVQRESAITGMRSMAEAALADIAAKEEARGAWANFAQGVIGDPAVSAAVGGLPGGGLIMGVLASGLSLLGGVALRGKGSRKRHDASFEEGRVAGEKAEKEKAEAADRAWEESQKAMELQLAKLTAQLAAAQRP